MILDMMPILSGAVDKLDFDFTYQIAADSIVASVFADVDFEKPMRVQGYVKNMAGYMVLYADVKLPYATACARCAEPVYSELEISFEKDIATGDVSRDNDDYIFILSKKRSCWRCRRKRSAARTAKAFATSAERTSMKRIATAKSVMLTQDWRSLKHY